MSKSLEDATNPVVRVDLIEHDRYGELFSEVESISAEILTINTNTGTFRCRLYDTDTGKFLYGNVDLKLSVIVEDAIIIDLMRYK